jgi:hypothetical protein
MTPSLGCEVLFYKSNQMSVDQIVFNQKTQNPPKGGHYQKATLLLIKTFFAQAGLGSKPWTMYYIFIYFSRFTTELEHT